MLKTYFVEIVLVVDPDHSPALKDAQQIRDEVTSWFEDLRAHVDAITVRNEDGSDQR